MDILLPHAEVVTQPGPHVHWDKPVELLTIPLVQLLDRVVVKVVVVGVGDHDGVDFGGQLFNITCCKKKIIKNNGCSWGICLPGGLYLLGPAHWTKELLLLKTGSVSTVHPSTSARTQACPIQVALQPSAPTFFFLPFFFPLSSQYGVFIGSFLSNSGVPGMLRMNRIK